MQKKSYSSGDFSRPNNKTSEKRFLRKSYTCAMETIELLGILKKSSKTYLQDVVSGPAV